VHHNVSDDQGNVVGTLCIDRQSQVCNILVSEVERLGDLVALAKALGAPRVQIVVPTSLVDQLQSTGWIEETDLKVMSIL